MKIPCIIAPMAVVSLCAHSQPSFITIGDLSGGIHVSSADGVSANGSIVTGLAFTDTGATGFIWEGEDRVMSQLPSILNSGSYTGTKVSPSGNFIIGRDGGLGAVWSDSIGAVSIGDVPGGADRSFLFAVNDAGVAVGQGSHDRNQFNAPLFRAIRWAPDGGLETLPLPGGASDLASNSTAWSVLDDGRVFGVSASGAWLYSDASGFEMREGADDLFRANSSGTFFGGTRSAGGSRAAYWTREEGLALLPLMEGYVFSNFFGMSDDGSVIVGGSTSPSESEEVIWLNQGTPVRIVDFATSLGLDMQGWTILNVIDVSADGSTIVGSARHVSWESGRSEGFVLTIPGPGGAVAVPVALAFLRRRRCGFSRHWRKATSMATSTTTSSTSRQVQRSRHFFSDGDYSTRRTASSSMYAAMYGTRLRITHPCTSATIISIKLCAPILITTASMRSSSHVQQERF